MMIQSLLTQEEYDRYSKIYNTYNPKKRAKSEPEKFVINGIEFKTGPPPCYIMGDKLTHSEIKITNERIDAKLKEHGLV